MVRCTLYPAECYKAWKMGGGEGDGVKQKIWADKASH